MHNKPKNLEESKFFHSLKIKEFERRESFNSETSALLFLSLVLEKWFSLIIEEKRQHNKKEIIRKADLKKNMSLLCELIGNNYKEAQKE